MAQSEVFTSTRFAWLFGQGGLLFPTELHVSPDKIVKFKRTIFSANEESINFKKVASVTLKTGIIFAEVKIESSGGSDAIHIKGLLKEDARRARSYIEGLQEKALSANKA